MSENIGVQAAVLSEAFGIPVMDSGAWKRWQRVQARDKSADGEFVYAVRTTGVFCRPSCPSRRPLEENVEFYATGAEAASAGFRACLRCHPERVKDARGVMVMRAARLLGGDADQCVGLRELARATGAGRLTVMRGFREVLGVTPGEFARARKVERFREASARERAGDAGGCKAKPATVTDAIYEAGFGSSSRLYEQAESLGMKPRAMLRGGKGMVIRYALATSPLGRMLVAATELGVCAILFGEDDDALAGDLRRRFAQAKLVAAKLLVAEKDARWLAEAVDYVGSQVTEHPLAGTFPLDVRATAFQLRVWKALRAIPRGETRSYSDVAREIGSPAAVRAVGAAIGANPVAVAVPCHRVLGKDGSMTGYRWGLERKKRLLAAEARQAGGERSRLK